MQANEYQEFTITTAIYPCAGTGNIYELMYLGNGLAGESGEINNKIAKLWRDGLYKNNEYWTEPLRDELGDAIYYLARICDSLGTTLEDEMQRNFDKLQSRKARGVIGGNGDNR